MSRTDERVEDTAEAFYERVGEVYRSDSRRDFATLIRLLGDSDLAEDALHNAFAAALERWPEDGMPANPRAWLVSAGRFKASAARLAKGRHGDPTALSVRTTRRNEAEGGQRERRPGREG